MILPYQSGPDGGRVLMVRQYRYAIGQDLLEFPAGIVEAGEDPAHAARRELAEETGLEAARWVTLPPVFRMPGNSNERTHFYLAAELPPPAATASIPRRRLPWSGWRWKNSKAASSQAASKTAKA